MTHAHLRATSAPATLLICLIFGLFAASGCGDEPDSGGGVASANADAGGGIGNICKATEDCPCENDKQCESGVCIEGPDGEKKCGKPCGDGCPNGWQCKNFSTPDKAIFVCVPSTKPDCVPTVEECDGVDNDCDGKTDETFCDDGNECTDDICDPKLAVDGSKGCTAVNLDVPCDDGDLCTENDFCKGGKCQDGTPKSCDDFNDCTTDSCIELSGACTNTVTPGPCSDGSACTIGDVCADGICQPGPPPDCDDSNPCTDDSCDAKDGCQNTNNEAQCEDGDLCTPGDQCKDGACESAKPIDCDDNNACTKNFCDAALVSDLSNGCTQTWVTDACDDGDDCTYGDACKGGQCAPGTKKDCDDNNSCTVDTCDKEAGCKNAVNPQDLNCDDGNACTTDDKCTHEGKCVGTGPDCNDNKPCTVDSCDPNTGKCVHANNTGAACTDGDNCTLGDNCVNGACVAASKKLCDDGVACTDDTCDQATGSCVFAPNTANCDDGNPCTKGDVCAGGKCAGLPQPATACSDGNGCTVDSCDPATRKCVNKATANGVLCADADQCTQGDSCQKGVCTSGPALYCDDNNPCTDDTCNATTGTCENKPNNAACDDNNKCTSGDQCSNGQCVSGKNACECEKDADCASKEDGNLCNGTLFCEKGTQNCKVNTSTIAVCDKSKDTECASFACAPKSGVCEATPKKDGIPCDADGSVCSNGDACKAGICEPGAKVVCDDFNPCTDDSCDAKKGCQNTNNSAGCFDGDHCTANDVCVAGVCKPGKSVSSCNDGDPCTGDKCNPVTGNCQFAPISGPACDDGNACTTGDVCVGGGCKPTGTKPPCDDGNPCTIDKCNTKTGSCDATPGFDGLGCNDGNQCTNGDFCQSGKCQPGSVLGCFDGGACQTGKCDVATGKCNYTATNENGKCNDGDACSLGDACASGKCTPKSFTKCDDSNLCTNDSCNKKTGKCVFSNKPVLPWTPCDDGNVCTRDWYYLKSTKKTGDVCRNGKCFGHNISCNDGNPCTQDSCDKVKGCQHKYLGNIPCNDGNACTVGDNCSSGKCKGAGKTCNDGNPCTNNVCHTTKGCQYPFNTAGCNDGSVCTLTDRCKNGKCSGVTPLVCDDGKPCTKDSCHPKTGCANNNDDTLPCSDAEPCTTGDFCKDGKCQSGKPTDCNDNNECTTDTCSDGVGCQHTDVGDKPCNDDNVCTNPDACKDGKCHSTGLNKCDDGNECTTDSCHPTLGCQNVNFNGTCSDGDACTQGDHCKDGKCLVAGPLSCDDKNNCTNDSCDKTDGCKHEPATGTSDAALSLGSDVQTKTYTKTKEFDGKQVPADIENAVIADTTHGKWKAAIAGSSWVWRTKTVADGEKDDTVHFVREFSVPQGSSDLKASIQVTADDSYSCTVNGKAATSGKYSDAPPTVDIAASVVTGDNTVVCTVVNKGVAGGTASSNPAGLLFGLKLSFKLNKLTCDDSNVCTALDTCELGQCVGSNGLNCNDGNGCTTDTCDPAVGCKHVAASGTSCDDGDDCTLGDACQGTKCVPSKTNSCDDGNLCTQDSCKTIGGCQNEAKKFGTEQKLALVSGTSTLVSTDKTVGSNGLPVPKNLKQAVKFSAPLSDWAQIGGATWIWHSATLADPTKSETAYFQQDFKIADKSETLRGTLHIAADNAFECYLNNQLVGVTPKNSDAYKKAQQLDLGGALKIGDNRLICAVHNIGKVGDTAKTNAAGLSWKVEASWYKAGESPSCDDGNACTKDDGCIFGFCLGGSPNTCDDNNSCTNDSCDPSKGCANKGVDTNPCNDGSVCTNGDYCKDGKCGGKTQISCDDGNGCTEDLCHALSGCYGEAKADGDSCDDGSVCTTDTKCASGACKNGAPKQCDDGNPCTTDTCFPLIGCTSKPADDTKCNDGDSCTEDDICKNGKCLGKKGNQCDDGNACTADNCTKDNGCTHGPASGAPCDDGNLCTQGDKCDKGTCTAGKVKDCFDTQQCTLDSCDSQTGKCTFSPVSDGECDDGNLCTLNDKCKAGKCQPGEAPGCSDGNTCTTDNCNPADGKCAHDGIQDGTGCNDGNACTHGDRCLSSKCGGTEKSCDDDNDCTTDSCDPATGICSHKAVSDGTTCDVVGKCKAGACLIK